MLANASRRPSGWPRGVRPERDDRRAAGTGRRGRSMRTGSPCSASAQVARLAVRPVEHALLAVDAQPDVVLAAGGRLRHGERAARAAVELDQRRHVVDDLAPGHQRADVGDDARDGQRRRRSTRDAARGSRSRSSPAPARCAAGRGSSESGCSAGRPRRASRVPLWMYSTCTRRIAPSAPSRTSVPRVARHRIRRVAVRDGEQRGRSCARARDEVAGLREVVRDRLVADDVEAGVERRGGERIVRVVGRHDRDGVDAVRPRASPAPASRRRRRSCAPASKPERRRRPRASAPDRSRTRRPTHATSRPSRPRRGACGRSTTSGPPPMMPSRSGRPKRSFSPTCHPPVCGSRGPATRGNR